MAEYLITEAEAVASADAIRAKTGSTDEIEWKTGTGFADAISAIESGSSGGGSVETCAVRCYKGQSTGYVQFTTYTDDNELTVANCTVSDGDKLSVLKNTILIIEVNVFVGPMDAIEDYLNMYTTAGTQLGAYVYGSDRQYYDVIFILQITSDGILELP